MFGFFVVLVRCLVNVSSGRVEERRKTGNRRNQQTSDLRDSQIPGAGGCQNKEAGRKQWDCEQSVVLRQRIRGIVF
jgi:hypothetical protein